MSLSADSSSAELQLTTNGFIAWSLEWVYETSRHEHKHNKARTGLSGGQHKCITITYSSYVANILPNSSGRSYRKCIAKSQHILIKYHTAWLYRCEETHAAPRCNTLLPELAKPRRHQCSYRYIIIIIIQPISVIKDNIHLLAEPLSTFYNKKMYSRSCFSQTA